MEKLMTPLHLAMSVMLLCGYGWLIYRFAHKDADADTTTWERGVAYLVRVLLLAVFLTGLMLTVLLQRPVHPFHHYAVAGPILGVFALRLVPSFHKTGNVYRAYMWVFVFIALCVLAVAAAAHLSILPKL